MEKYFGLIIIICFMVYVLLILFIVHKNEIKLQKNQHKHELEMQKNQHQHEIKILKGETSND